MNPPQLPASTHISHVHLRVADLGRSLGFYRDLLGLKVSSQNGATVSLSADTRPMVVLTEHPGAVGRPAKTTGLFHVAVRFPSRVELARAFKRLHDGRWPFQGFADHGVSEALYLADPDDIGIELYVDRPRKEWRYVNGELKMGTWELDLDNLVSELSNVPSPQANIHPRTDIGHIHLNISSLKRAEEFYADFLGFAVTQRNYPGALFVAAGGYHHHIGLNTWAGQGAPAPPPDAVGLIRFGIEIPDVQAFDILKSRSAQQTGFHGRESSQTSFSLQDYDSIQMEVSCSTAVPVSPSLS